MSSNGKAAVALAIILGGALAAEPAFAWGHSRVRVGFYFGVPLAAYSVPYTPLYYPPHYSPAAVVVAPQPTAYVEQGVVAASQLPAGYWHYCQDSRAYYPYVRTCMSGWQRVLPQPAGN